MFTDFSVELLGNSFHNLLVANISIAETTCRHTANMFTWLHQHNIETFLSGRIGGDDTRRCSAINANVIFRLFCPTARQT